MNLPHALPGQVYFVGAGPGDPGLLTLKGAQYLGEAEVVLYDDLVERRLLELVPPGCEKIYVGKRGGRKSHPQEEINALLVERARRQRRVVRLKGGDPFIFGRGGEEALALAAAGIPFEVVSGVSAAAGVPAYAGIPLTQRGMASAAVLVTGHEDPTKAQPAVDWERLARLEATLVIFMGVRRLESIAAALLRAGRPAASPAALVEWGTWPAQRTVVSTLKDLAAAARRRRIQPPALAIVGEVVSLRARLNWFEAKPLFGRRVLVTRSRPQAAALQLLLESQGARVELMPLLDLQPPADGEPLDRSIEALHTFAWVIFTSPNSVDFFFARLRQRGGDARRFGRAAVAAVGRATAEHLRRQGIFPDLVPAQQSQEGLVEAFAEIPVAGKDMLLPTSDRGRTLLAAALEKRGARLRRVTAYTNRPPAQVEIPAQLEAIDLVLFASPSSVEHFAARLGRERARRVLSRTRIACLGPTTARAVAELGLEVHIQPAESRIEALVDAVCAHFRAAKPQEDS